VKTQRAKLQRVAEEQAILYMCWSVQQPAGGAQKPFANADNVQFKYSDSEAGEGWDYSGHYANLKYFVVTKKMYADNPA
jgi:hypothetical protein